MITAMKDFPVSVIMIESLTSPAPHDTSVYAYCSCILNLTYKVSIFPTLKITKLRLNLNY
jgi:hypothetical protein